MWIEYHDELRRPTRVKASRVVVYDDFGNPVGAMFQASPDHIIAGVADDEAAFKKLLRRLGVDKTVVVTTVKTEMQSS